MRRAAFPLIACLAAVLASALPSIPAAAGMADPAAHRHMMEMAAPGAPAAAAHPALPTQAGQGAFAAIQEIVAILMADPETDWSKVDIDALRQHLADMNAVTLSAKVANTPIEGGMRFDVTGEGDVRDSIRRMVTAHAMAMSGLDGWTMEAHEIDGGASLSVRAPAKDAAKLRGLGFFGVLTLGMHHQMHHLMIARGAHPHE
jgi:hypothetical protein